LTASTLLVPRARCSETIHIASGDAIVARDAEWRSFVQSLPGRPVGADHRWLLALRDGLGHVPYCLEAHRDGELLGLLPLCLVRGPIFGRFLISLPYVTTCGCLTRDATIETALIDRAIELANELHVKHLELRAEHQTGHKSLVPSHSQKVLMRRALPASTEVLWKQLDSKVRNQIRKGEKQGFDVQWGSAELLPSFYQVFSRNMRDLGTPVFGKSFFASILRHFSTSAELCVVSLRERPVAAALLVHGQEITEVPSASNLREFNSTNANMFMYWQLLTRAVERGQQVFDFGRSTLGSGTERFKAQWGAEPVFAQWQCYYRIRRSHIRKESRGFSLLSRAWQCLPVRIAEFLGPAIVRGIP
jgi:serine/alanine adding enzyme